MNRKEWLRTFLELADGNKPALEYRKRLRIMVPQLPKILLKIPAFRKELADILDKEAKAAEDTRLAELAKEARKISSSTPALRAKSTEDVSESTRRPRTSAYGENPCWPDNESNA